MSRKKNKGLTSKHLLIVLSVMLVCIAGIVVFWGSNNSLYGFGGSHTADVKHLQLNDPLPGELVMHSLIEDSVQDVRKEDLRRSMTKVIQDYRKKFRQDHFNGYFMTDLDNDGLPELWVKIGNYRDNAKLELYYPMPDGTLRKSETYAEPGQYYIGEDYIMQVVGKGPGYINVNRISINNGMMKVDNVRSIDLYTDPNASLPKFAEREIRDTSFNNLTVLNRALML